MDGNLNLEPDVIKSATELNSSDCHEGGEVSKDSDLGINSEVPSTNLPATLGVHPENGIIPIMTGITCVAGFIPTTNNDGLTLAQQILAEPMADAAVSAGPCEESREQAQGVVVLKQIPILFFARIDPNLANSASSVSSCTNNAASSLTAQSNVENTGNEDSSAGPIDCNISQESHSQEALSSTFEKSSVNSSVTPVELEDSITGDKLDQAGTIEFDFPEFANISSPFAEPSTSFVDFEVSEPFPNSDIGRTVIETTQTPEAAIFPSTLCSTPSETEQSKVNRTDTRQVTVEIIREDSSESLNSVNNARKSGVEQSEERPFSCSQCPEQFLVKENLDKHLLIHSNETPFFSAQLSAQLTSNGHLSDYVSNHVDESEKELFLCSECSAVFAQMSELILHSRSHCIDQTYSCEECGEQFSNQKHLFQHLPIHSAKRTFDCEKCQKPFVRRNDLMRHLFVHCSTTPLQRLPDPDKNRFYCKQCPAKFTEKSHLKQHLYTHSEKYFCCTKCPAKFQSKHNLIQHWTIHSKARLFSCKQCKINFLSLESFDQHFKMSSTCLKERPFSCEQCSVQFKTAVNFKTEALLKMHAILYHASESPGSGACA